MSELNELWLLFLFWLLYVGLGRATGDLVFRIPWIAGQHPSVGMGMSYMVVWPVLFPVCVVVGLIGLFFILREPKAPENTIDLSEPFEPAAEIITDLDDLPGYPGDR